MAIRHIRKLARELASKYEDVHNLCLGYMEGFADVCLSPEDTQAFAEAKAPVDAHLSLLSVAFSASVNSSNFAQLKRELESPVKSFADALSMVLDDASKPDAPEKTQELIALYSEKLRTARETYLILERVEFYKNLPNTKKRCKKWLRKFLLHSHNFYPLEPLEEAILKVMPPFYAVDKEIEKLKNFILSAEREIAPADAGDLEE